MPVAPNAVVQARPIAPPRISLLSSAILVDESGDRWEVGFSVIPESCSGNAGIVSDPCTTDTRTATNTCLAFQEHKTFGIWTSDKVSAFNFQHRDAQARVTRKLQAAESKMIEQQLYSDIVGHGSPKIQSSSATVVTGAARPPVAALSAIEDALADCSDGIRAMIHVRPGIAVQWLQFGIIRREGDSYLTPMDNIVVPGRGYTGGPPAGGAPGATEWIYTTPMVEVRRGPIKVLPGSISDATTMVTNDTTYWAERVASAAFDPNCCRLALEMTRTNA